MSSEVSHPIGHLTAGSTPNDVPDQRNHHQAERDRLVEHGGFLGLGHATSFIPVEAITEITADDVVINHTRDHVAAAPPYHPGLVSDRGYHGTVYGHYGYSPYWGGAGYPWSGYIGRSTM